MKILSSVAIAAVILIGITAARLPAQVGGFSDLNYWGTGPNRSALVVDWNDGKTNEVLAWGFNWSGSLNVEAMVVQLAGLDPRFNLRLDSDASFGLALFGIGYQSGGEEFGLSGAQNPAGAAVDPVFTSGISDMNENAGTTEAPASSTNVAPANPANHYAEGWNDNGFWQLFLGGESDSTATPSSNYPATWTAANFGLSSINLVNDGWYALSISEPDFTSNVPGSAFAAVPEPAAVPLLLLGVAILNVYRRRS